MFSRWALAGSTLLMLGTASGQITGLSFEVDTCFYANLDTTGLFDPDDQLPGFTTYRVYADFTQPGDQLQAVYALGFGETITSPWTLDAACGCFDHAFGSSIGVGVNPVLLDAFPDLAFHSYYTMDHHPGSSIAGGNPVISGAADLPEICNTNLADAAMYVLGGVFAGADLRIQIAQVTTCGPFELAACFQVQGAGGAMQNWCTDDAPLQVDPPCAPWAASTTAFEINGNASPVAVTIPAAAAWPVEIELFDAEADTLFGAYLAAPSFTAPPGNYYAALKDAFTCRDTTEVFCIPPAFYTCSGTCIDDTDGDGICDPLEIPGCLDPEACNYVPEATDLVTCVYAEPGYDCNGDCLADGDGDGICDPFEIPGCTGEWACNFNPLATDDDGSCTYLPTYSISGPITPVAGVSVTYTYPANTCDWEVVSGNLLAGQGTGEATVQWDDAEEGQIAVQAITDTCTSAPIVLSVAISPNSIVPALTTVPLRLTPEGIEVQAQGLLRIWDLGGRLLLDRRATPGDLLLWPATSGTPLMAVLFSADGSSTRVELVVP